MVAIADSMLRWLAVVYIVVVLVISAKARAEQPQMSLDFDHQTKLTH